MRRAGRRPRRRPAPRQQRAVYRAGRRHRPPGLTHTSPPRRPRAPLAAFFRINSVSLPVRCDVHAAGPCTRRGPRPARRTRDVPSFAGARHESTPWRRRLPRRGAARPVPANTAGGTASPAAAPTRQMDRHRRRPGARRTDRARPGHQPLLPVGPLPLLVPAAHRSRRTPRHP
ncbi:hypothetical protein SGPA1_10088 [Streptomyces misionensis JCM 4497]